MAPSEACVRYTSRAVAISTSTFFPTTMAALISLTVFFVASSPSISGMSLRMSSGAFARRSSKLSSSSSSWIRYAVNSAWSLADRSSRSGRSLPTTFASS